MSKTKEYFFNKEAEELEGPTPTREDAVSSEVGASAPAPAADDKKVTEELELPVPVPVDGGAANAQSNDVALISTGDILATAAIPCVESRSIKILKLNGSIVIDFICYEAFEDSDGNIYPCPMDHFKNLLFYSMIKEFGCISKRIVVGSYVVAKMGANKDIEKILHFLGADAPHYEMPINSIQPYIIGGMTMSDAAVILYCVWQNVPETIVEMRFPLPDTMMLWEFFCRSNGLESSKDLNFYKNQLIGTLQLGIVNSQEKNGDAALNLVCLGRTRETLLSEIVTINKFNSWQKVMVYDLLPEEAEYLKKKMVGSYVPL